MNTTQVGWKYSGKTFPSLLELLKQHPIKLTLSPIRNLTQPLHNQLGRTLCKIINTRASLHNQVYIITEPARLNPIHTNGRCRVFKNKPRQLAYKHIDSSSHATTIARIPAMIFADALCSVMVSNQFDILLSLIFENNISNHFQILHRVAETYICAQIKNMPRKD